MCPLGETCPSRLQGRWPDTNIPNTTPVGVRCCFAHGVNEINL